MIEGRWSSLGHVVSPRLGYSWGRPCPLFLLGGRVYFQNYQLPPYSKVVLNLDGLRNMRFFIFYLFIFFLCLGFRFLHLLSHGGVARIVATCPFLIGEQVLFPVNAFSVFPYFSRQTFLTLCLSFFISLLSFLRLIFLVLSHFLHFFSVSDFSELIVAAAHFALSLSGFLPHFQVRSPFLRFFPFRLYCILLFCTPIFFFWSCIFFLNGGLC